MPPAGDGFDRLFETARALGEETRFRIYRQLCVSGRATPVADLADAFSLHPNAIRQHLAVLERAGLAVSTSDRPSGAGRPRRLWRASPEPVEASHPPRSMRVLAGILARALDAAPATPRRLSVLGRSWARSWADEHRPTNGARPRTRAARADRLATYLAEWGWKPVRTDAGGAVAIETGGCLFHDLAPHANGRCCALEEGLLRGLVEATMNGRARVIRTSGCRLRVEA